jgi:phosphoenolpyruvate carboxykinase (GTP)
MLNIVTHSLPLLIKGHFHLRWFRTWSGGNDGSAGWGLPIMPFELLNYCRFKYAIFLIQRGVLTPLSAYENNYLCRTDPRDCARVESKTWMVTREKYEVCEWIMQYDLYIILDGHPHPGGSWAHHGPLDVTGRVCGRVGWPFSGLHGRPGYVCDSVLDGTSWQSIGQNWHSGWWLAWPTFTIRYNNLLQYLSLIQLTDSTYVVLSMRVMTRILPDVSESLGDRDFVRGIHSVGLPRPVKRKYAKFIKH